MNQTEPNLKKYFDAAPDEIKSLVKKISDTPEMTEFVARRNGLSDSKIFKLKLEIILTLLNLEPISRFRANLVQELGVTYDQALKISSDVNAQIFGAEVVETLKMTEADMEKMESEEVVESEESPEEPETFRPSQPDSVPVRPTPETDHVNLPSIVDQKLSGAVHSGSGKEKYKGPDPYREPIN